MAALGREEVSLGQIVSDNIHREVVGIVRVRHDFDSHDVRSQTNIEPQRARDKACLPVPEDPLVHYQIKGLHQVVDSFDELRVRIAMPKQAVSSSGIPTRKPSRTGSRSVTLQSLPALLQSEIGRALSHHGYQNFSFDKLFQIYGSNTETFGQLRLC